MRETNALCAADETQAQRTQQERCASGSTHHTQDADGKDGNRAQACRKEPGCVHACAVAASAAQARYTAAARQRACSRDEAQLLGLHFLAALRPASCAARRSAKPNAPCSLSITNSGQTHACVAHAPSALKGRRRVKPATVRVARCISLCRAAR
jgi:hypothetical protein